MLGAVLAGAGLRLFFIWRFSFGGAGDTRVYEALARNWLDHGTYGVWVAGRLTPADLRMPGYPAFLAGIYSLFGPGQLPILLAQALVDLGTCWLVAVLAARLAPAESRARVRIAALWLAALCPFVANYAAAPLSEVLATFFTAAALLAFVPGPGKQLESQGQALRPVAWLLGGALVGLGTLVRPETPLVLIAAAVVIGATLWRQPYTARGFSSRVRALTVAAAAMGLGLLLPLTPWAIRNWATLHEVQFLSPRYANLPSEYVPRGFYSWTRTWLWRFGDVYLVPWKVEDEPILVNDLPAAAFDSPQERAGTAALLAQYNDNLAISPELDQQFAALARERTRRHPLRTYLWVPLQRSAAMWLTPRVELLPYSGHLWPIGKNWRDDHKDFSVTTSLGLLNIFFVGLGVAGAWRACRRGFDPGAALLIIFILVRTAFLTRIETPEPRYVLECFPALLALGAQLWSRPAAAVSALRRARGGW